jgi:hypothetical protein
MLAWPTLLKPNAGGFAPFVRSLSGGQSLSGIEQVVPQFHDRWQARFSFALNRNDRVLALRSLLAALRGRANTVALPAFECGRSPAFGPVAPVTAFQFSPINATEIVVATDGAVPAAGYLFSIGPRMYVSQAVVTLSPGRFAVTIWPWLRVAAPPGTPLNFSAPVCEMRLASDAEGADALTSLEVGRLGTVSLTFDEALTQADITELL